MTEPDPGLVESVDVVMDAAVAEWWRDVLAVERAYEPDPPEIIRRMSLNGLTDPEEE